MCCLISLKKTSSKIKTMQTFTVTHMVVQGALGGKVAEMADMAEMAEVGIGRVMAV